MLGSGYKSTAGEKPRVLVFGAGNTFYGDDGIGYCLVKALEKCAVLDGVELVGVQALNPGHATMLEGYDYAVFIDAYIDPDNPGAEIVVHELDPARLDSADLVLAIEGIEPHSLDPLKLLVLARAANVFNGVGFLIGIKPERVAFNEPLSRRVIERGLRALQELVSVLERIGVRPHIDEDCARRFLEENCSGPLLD